MKITKLIAAPGRTGFFFDDQKAIKAGAEPDGANIIGEPLTAGFSSVRQPGESISILLLLEDGQIAWGDCAAVQYSGAGGRDPLFLAADFIPIVNEFIAPKLIGRDISEFRPIATEIEKWRLNDRPLHTALRYGLSQALLDAVSKSHHELMCETVAREYGTSISEKTIPIFSQSGDDRYDNADKMILKSADVLPHALINNLEAKLGRKGEKLVEYLQWVRDRILTIRLDPAYQPVLHIDVYGTIGEAFGIGNYDAICDYLAQLEQICSPFHLRIEGPIDAGSREGQIEHLSRLTRALDEREIGVELVADEWCNTLEDVIAFTEARAGHMLQIKTPDLGSIHNTIEAVLYCKQHKMGAYQGGTCNETDRSAQVCVHAAMATQPAQILAKPGMGVDEGYMIVFNEMQRIIHFRQLRN
jgi:methylaspartate ammonia-lyase